MKDKAIGHFLLLLILFHTEGSTETNKQNAERKFRTCNTTLCESGMKDHAFPDLT